MKTPGLDSALSALKYWRTKNQIVANNLANVGSPGFRAQVVFAELLPGERPEARTALDLKPGALNETGGPLDLAIDGNGFFVVDTPAGERLTRRGSFQLDEHGYLVDPSGHLVLGETGIIAIPPDGHIAINDAGEILVGDEVIDRLRISRPEDGTTMTPEGGALLRPEGRLESVWPEQRGVRQGFLEDSNVNSLEGLTDLITIQRRFVAAQRALETLDQVAGTIANDLARIT